MLLLPQLQLQLMMLNGDRQGLMFSLQHGKDKSLVSSFAVLVVFAVLSSQLVRLRSCLWSLRWLWSCLRPT
jgi:hypothetical protein